MSRVLHVIPAVAPRYGGPSVAVLGMGRALRAARIWAVVATTDADGRNHLDVPRGEIVTYEDVPTVFFRRVCSESFKWSPGLARWLAGHVDEFDLVHVHGVFSHALLAAARACRAKRVPYIVRPLGTLDPWSLARHGWRKALLLRGGAWRALTGAAAMHYTTNEERRLATSALPGLPAGVVVPLGVEDELFRSERDRDEIVGASPSAPYMLSLSRMHPKKGLDHLIRAFHRASERGVCRDWRLVLAGDGAPEYVRQLQALADDGPAAARITFEGWVSGEARRALLQQASLFVLPSSQENFGIGVVEAMAAGVPVLVGPGVNVASEIAAAQAGWSAEPEAFADALAALCTAPDALRARGLAAREWAEQFRWDRVSRSLLQLYADVVRPADRERTTGVQPAASTALTGEIS